MGKSGLLGPYRPAQVARVLRALPDLAPNPGAAYRLAAAVDPDRAAVVDDAGAASFAEMDRRARAVAAGLAGLGVGEGDTVALLCRNHRGFLLALAALGWLGADVVHLNTGFAAPQVADVVAAQGVGALVVDEDLLGLTAAVDPALPVVVAWEDRPVPGRPSLATLGGSGAAAPRSRRVGRQVLLTSGTTGRPKGASRRAPRDPTAVLGVLARIPYRRGDVTVMAAPMFHAWGLANAALGLVFGATLVLPRRFDPEDTLARIERYRARVLVAVPVMLQRILELPEGRATGWDTSSLRVVAVSGSALPGDLATRWMDTYGDHLHSLYGSTEAGWVSVAGPAELRAAPGCAGRVLPGIDVRILDDAGTEVPEGSAGRIFVRSAISFDGYTGSSEGDTGSSEGGTGSSEGGYLSTGDVGHTAGGLLWVDGREDDMIVSGGENVFPREVEDLLAGHPAVAEATVAGVADDRFGQRLEAWVALRPGASATPEQLTDLVRSRLARYKVPRAVHLVGELPRNSAGKVVKRSLPG